MGSVNSHDISPRKFPPESFHSPQPKMQHLFGRKEVTHDITSLPYAPWELEYLPTFALDL